MLHRNRRKAPAGCPSGVYETVFDCRIWRKTAGTGLLWGVIFRSNEAEVLRAMSGFNATPY